MLWALRLSCFATFVVWGLWEAKGAPGQAMRPELMDRPFLNQQIKDQELGLQLTKLQTLGSNLTTGTPIQSAKPSPSPPQKDTQSTTNGPSATTATRSFDASNLSSLNLELENTPRDIAQYIFWTGDETGVAWALNEVLQDGIISRDDGIKFLEDIRLNLEWLRNRYSQHQSSSQPIQGGSKMSKNEGSFAGNDWTMEMLRRVGTSDSKFREFSLQQVIYHMAKEIFSTGTKKEATIQRLTAFVQNQAAQGKIPRDLETSILDTLVTALVDTVMEKEGHKVWDTQTTHQSNPSDQN